MGRIADALKRAEQERRQGLTAQSGSDSATATLAPPTARSPNAPASTSDSGGSQLDEPVGLVEGLSESLVPFFERSSLVTEQYRSLRTRLLSQNPNYQHRVIAITSAVPKEAKTISFRTLPSSFSTDRNFSPSCLIRCCCRVLRSSIATFIPWTTESIACLTSLNDPPSVADRNCPR